MSANLLQSTSSTSNVSFSYALGSGASNYQLKAHVTLNTAATVAEAESIVKDDWIRSHYELVPKGTIARLARDYKTKLASRPYKKTSDIDLPMVDDEEDW